MEHTIPVRSSGLGMTNYYHGLTLGLPRSCIYKFSGSRLVSSTSTSAITAMTQSPAIDVVGIGFTSGEISVYDVRADERLMRMFMTGGGIRSLSFRSGGLYTFFALLY